MWVSYSRLLPQRILLWVREPMTFWFLAGTYVFAADLLLGQLHLDERPHGGEDLPPGPVLHAAVLLDVLLDAADGQVLDLGRVRTQDMRVRSGVQLTPQTQITPPHAHVYSVCTHHLTCPPIDNLLKCC